MSKRTWLTFGLAFASLLAGAGVASQLRAGAREEGECAGLTVAAAPEIAGVITDVVKAEPVKTLCAAPVVKASDPAEVADAIAQGRGDRPDVWIPDSTVWLNRKPPALTGTSIARTPIVVGLAEDVAGTLGWRAAQPASWPELGALLPGAGELAGPVRFGLPDPDRTPATVGVLLGLQSAVAGRPDARTALTLTLRAATPNADLGSARLAVAASEQRVWTHNASHPDNRLVAVYAGYSLDYPFVVFNERARAERLLAVLRGDAAQHRLREAGFRDPNGTAGAQLTAEIGVDPTRPGAGPVPDNSAIDMVTRTLTSITLGSRLLAVVDVSGSMAARVGGGTTTRLQLALGAAVNGLALYPDDTEVGLWTFATNLSGDVDHRELVPIVRLGRGDDGVTGREQLARALTQVQPVPHGDTGLYDTALAAVRAVRRDWDPERVNSVVLLTDGRNDDPHGIGLDELVRTLAAEDDPARPVFLITIGYGTDSDFAALAAMSRATGAETYRVTDPNRIREVILDAIGRRACRPSC